jgi:hypothetical protein
MIARQSTARTIMVGPVLDASGVAVTDGVVGDFKVSKNGGAPGALNGSATLTHRHTGFYSLALTASDLDTVGGAQITIDDSTNCCPMANITVVEEAVYDALFAASAGGYQVPIWAAANSTVNLSGTTVSAVSGAVGSVTGGVTVTTNNDKTGYTASTVSDKTGYSLADAPPSASTIASQVRTELTTELARIDAAVTTRLAAGDYAAPPSASTVASQVRTELTTELARIDAAITTRLASAGYTAPDNAGITSISSAVGALNNLSAAQVNAEVDAAIETYHLDHLFATTYDPASKPGAADALLNELVESDGGVSRFTQNALEQAPGGAGGGSATIENQEAILAALNGSVVLAADGLDLVDMTVPTGGATNFAEAMAEVWRDDHRKKTTNGSLIVRYADDGTTVLTEQTVTFNRNTRTVTKGAAE